ncbi:MAG: UTP--glucose-1-phosphate uridylyltransferase [Chloroflexi bacterium]|nr:UTP--glucose-1-phosphate uridylyltransferase [Chloroflexota bacterium]MBU1660946.1 UTP--glucose-1-phosphate uridylyltransferase [Chloroflexota bacterium]
MTQLITKAIIPAAGLGSRLLPATKSQPKEMLPVGRKPVLQYVVEELQEAGLRQLLIITGRRKRSIEDHFDSDPQLVSALKQAGNEARMADLAYIEDKSRFFYTRQSTPKGLGHAVSLGAEFADDDDCVVALGDSLIAAEYPSAPLQAMMEAHRHLGAAAIVAVEKVPPEEAFRYGIVSTAGGVEPPPGEPVAMTDIVEKPTSGSAPSTLAVAARYVFSPAIFEALERTLPDKKGEIQLSDAIRLLIRRGEPVYAWLFPPDHRRYDVGNFESYFRAFIDFALADERYGYLVRKYIKAKAYEL